MDNSQEQVSQVLIDLKSLNGVDSSAASSFLNIRRLAGDHYFSFVVSIIDESVARKLEKAAFLLRRGEHIKIFPDLGRGLEWCEGQQMISTLLSYLEPRLFAIGEVLVDQGDK